MGKTTRRYRDDDNGRRQKDSREPKHSRNVPGRGMRVINTWYDEDDDYFDDNVGVEDEVEVVPNKNTR